jgi:non-specific serine/threonine protein kinase
MLETVAAFGHQRLGQAFTTARDAHLEWATGLAKEAAAELDGASQSEWLDRIASELDNMRAAMQWSLDGGDPMLGMIISGSLFRFWYIRAVREGRRWLDLFLEAATPAPPELQARILFAAGSLTQSQGDYEKAADLLEESLRLSDELGDKRGGAYALHYLLRARWGTIPAPELREMIDNDLAEFRAIQDPVGLVLTLLFDILWHLQYGSVDDVETVPELMAVSDQIGAPQLVAHGAEIPAVVRWFKGDFDSAAVLLDKAAGLYLEISNPQCSAHFLENASGWAQRSGRVEEAAALLGSASALRLDTGIPTPSYENFLFDDILTAVRDELGDRFTDAWDRGSERSMEEALDYVRQITSTSASKG